MDLQLTLGLIAAGLALGFVAHDSGFTAYVRQQFRVRRWPVHPMRVSLAKRWRWQ